MSDSILCSVHCSTYHPFSSGQEGSDTLEARMEREVALGVIKCVPKYKNDYARQKG